jgi:hypothetical protein
MAKIPEDIFKRARREMASKGGLARAAALTAEQRRAIAKRAGKTRWAKHRRQKKERG